MMENLVSVIVATYRREDTLYRALESIKKQTYPNVEIILVDDNDDVFWNERVKKIADQFDNLTLLVNHPNQGSALTRNIGISASHGDFVTFLDDDDLY